MQGDAPAVTHVTVECIERQSASEDHGPHYWLDLAQSKLAAIEHPFAREVRELIAAARLAI
ncbi:hypothetical protein CO712_18845 [Burkholderia gladioli pv. gladioli]|nr:hypothetical protein CO712_18845 [Burkholderia gladioli pv. gladioli]